MLARCQYCNTRVRAKQLPVHEKHCPRKRFALRTQAQKAAQEAQKEEAAQVEVQRPKVVQEVKEKKTKKAKA